MNVVILSFCGSNVSNGCADDDIGPLEIDKVWELSRVITPWFGFLLKS
jgi:hypothetical protein